MNRYLVFVGQVYYSVGGACDFLASKENIEEAIELAQRVIGTEINTFDKSQYFDDDKNGSTPIEWSHVFDLKEEKIIKEFGRSPLGRQCELVKDF
jgi:hypothetical protein